MTARPLVVLQSFPDVRPTTNPYIVMLHRALIATDGVEVRTFTWQRALLGRYDVFHAHWPESRLLGRTAPRRLVLRALFALLLVRLRLFRTPIVRTQHNLELPSGLSSTERFLLTRFDRDTSLRILLNGDTNVEIVGPTAVIPHGHYRGWYVDLPKPPATPGKFGYTGLIRRYKNVDGLVAAFVALPGDVTLEVAGNPSNEDLAESLRTAAHGDPRITFTFAFLSDAEMVAVMSSSELVVLPYLHMHNSGVVLAALSVDRPVLVPANSTNALLSAEVGAGWIVQFEGDLTAETLTSALTAVRSPGRSARPDLSRRDWDAAGREHLAAYRAAGRARRRRGA